MSSEISDFSIYRYLYKKGTEYNVPVNATIELTYRCNQRCRHCYIDFDTESENELSLEDIRLLLKQLKELGTIFITYTGGEILLRNDIKDILKMTADMGFGLWIYTNGTLIDEDFIDFLSEEIKPVSVEISLYATDEETHDKITRLRGSFKRTMNAINTLIERELPLVVKNTWMKSNYHCYRDWMDRFFNKEGVVAKSSPDITPCDDGSRKSLDERLEGEEYKEFLSNQIEMLNLYKVDTEDEITDIDDIHQDTIFGCNIAGSTLCISPYGEMFPCIQMRVSGGNIKNEPVKKIWDNSHIFNYLRKLREFKISECYGCENSLDCNICIGNTWLTYRTLLTKDSWLCYSLSVKKGVVGDV